MNPIIIKKQEHERIRKINSVDELKEICKDRQVDFFIVLNYGLKSSKTIMFDTDTKRFEVDNDIDGTHQTLTEKGIIDDRKTNIGKAINQGAFFKY